MAAYEPSEQARTSTGGPATDSSIAHASSSLDELLRRASTELGEVWNSSHPALRRFEELRTRLRTGCFHLAVLGQFKRGKSTFLNALLGEELLPTGIVPLTALPTFISWAPSPIVRVWYRGSKAPHEFSDTRVEDIRQQLFRFVAEEANPNNRLDVARVELLYPSPLLNSGVVLIDTPGIGSTHRHNTDAARRILPECDAAVFVISADPPITEAETDYLAAIRPHVARLIFVLSKADYLGVDDQKIAVNFLRGVLGRLFPTSDPPLIFSLSGLRGLRGKQNHDPASVEESGVRSFEDYLVRYLASEKTTTLQAAVLKKASCLLAEAAGDLALMVRSLELPIEDLEKRRTSLSGTLAALDHEKQVIRDFSAGDRRRVTEQLEVEADRIRSEGRRSLLAEALAAVAQAPPGEEDISARRALAGIIPAFFDNQLRLTSTKFRQAVADCLTREHGRLDTLVGHIRQAAADLFEIPASAPEASEPFVLTQDPYWVTEKWHDSISAIAPTFFIKVLPRSFRIRHLRRDLETQVTDIVLRNVENLRWAILQSINDAFRRFAELLDERIAAALHATHGAIEAIAIRRHTAANQTEDELVRLRALIGRLEMTCRELTAMSIESVHGAVAPR